ncbi:FAD-dependent oxidoreductase [Methylocystis bryophila]|nr:FAD-dependent oxidoreductase [Methylocystis bryophila]
MGRVAQRIHVPVLVIGAGFAGLTSALFLGWLGVPCLLVERRDSLSTHPRAHGLNRRSMELLRSVKGLEAELFAASRSGPNDWTIAVSQTVTGTPISVINTKAMNDASSSLSPARLCSAGQDRVEPVLLRYARAHGADVRFSTSLVGFEQGADCVMAELREEKTGERVDVICDYLLAGDGAGSSVRKELGVEMEGPGVLTHAVSMLFEADLPSVLNGAGAHLYYLRNSEFTGAFVSCDDPRFGQLNVEYDPATKTPRDFGRMHCADLVRKALGTSELEVKVHDVLPWQMSASVAKQFSRGRVFLVGDAAHLTPPVGGLGGQGGIQDAADLAWKLAFVIKGYAGADLLTTYEAERRPVAHLANARGIANYVERMRPDREDIRIRSAEADYLNVVFGYRYRSRAIVPGPDDDGSSSEDPYAPSVSPGFRIPHALMNVQGKQLSLHDLSAGGFVLIAGKNAAHWMKAAARFAVLTGFPLKSYRIDADLQSTEDLHRTLRLDDDAALLIRPDGFVAWRGDGLQGADDRLASALDQICARSDRPEESRRA